MWYEKGSKKEVDFSKGIIGKSRNSNNIVILMPQLDDTKDDGYEIRGYNWFSLTNGEYNSCAYFKSPQAAIRAYEDGYDFYNLKVEDL